MRRSPKQKRNFSGANLLSDLPLPDHNTLLSGDVLTTLVINHRWRSYIYEALEEFFYRALEDANSSELDDFEPRLDAMIDDLLHDPDLVIMPVPIQRWVADPSGVISNDDNLNWSNVASLVTNGTLYSDGSPISNDTDFPTNCFEVEYYGNNLTATLSGFVANATYIVNIGYMEPYFADGTRVFDVTINGVLVEDNLAPFVIAGGKNIPLVRQYNVTANGSGQIVIVGTSVADNPTICAVEITSTSHLPQGTVNVAYPNLYVVARGGSGSRAFSATGLPAGMSINNLTGVISGTPTTTLSNGDITVTVTDTVTNQAANVIYHLTIAS